MHRSIASFTLLLALVPTVAFAQQNGDQPAAGAPANPEEVQPVAAPPPQPEPPAPVEPAKKADEKPAVNITYDKGMVFKSADDMFGLKLTFRNQIRYTMDRSTADGAEFLQNFAVVRSRLTLEGN